MREFNNCRILLGGDPDLNTKIKNKLLSLGYKWGDKYKKISTVNTCWLNIHDNGKITSSWYYNNSNKSMREIFPSDLGIVEEMKFEEGKWYKMIGLSTWYVKDKIKNTHLDSFREHIENGKYYNRSVNLGNEGTYKYTEIPLSEIQQYLPSGHVDKFKEEEYKVGDWVTVINDHPNFYKKIGDVFKIIEIGTDCFYFKEGCNVHKSRVRKATPEEIKSVTKSEKPFEFNKWYKTDIKDGLVFVKSKNTGYGFRSNYINYWFINNESFNWDLDCLELATDEEVEERLLNYAREMYPVGTKYAWKEVPTCISDGNFLYNYRTQIYSDSSGYCIYDGDGEWAEILSTPEVKESHMCYPKTPETCYSAIEYSEIAATLAYDKIKKQEAQLSDSDFDVDFQRNGAKMFFIPWQGINKKEPNILDATYQEVEIKLTKPKQIKF